MPSIAIPCLRYRDTPAAIDWLCEVFGFACQLAVPGIDGAIAHAQLTLDGGMIMLGSVSSEGKYGRLLAQPDELGGRETQTVYLQVKDADRVCERARNGGAVILEEPADTEFGSRGFLCRDPEGHVWNVGTYDPWQPEQLFNQP
ncbi:MAG: VOC family protein [Telluria sp.]